VWKKRATSHRCDLVLTPFAAGLPLRYDLRSTQGASSGACDAFPSTPSSKGFDEEAVCGQNYARPG
jgi:hypothetical protein